MHSKILITLALAAVCGCNGELVAPASPSTVELAVRPSDELRRAPVYMDHGKHTEALGGAKSCAECHETKREQLVLAWAPGQLADDPDALMSLYHRECSGCHWERGAQEKVTGPVTCGGCHLEQVEQVVAPHNPRWDYSLHGRHVVAEKEKCETCHHVYDEEAKQLVYAKGQESACRDCHGAVTEGRNLAWSEAAHQDCLGCHRQRKGDTGPVLCVGCHDAATVAAIKKMADPPRMLRGQPDKSWIEAEGTQSLPVRFDHLGHEAQAATCSDCHHQTLAKCSSCHTLTGSEEGNEITLAAAYHDTGVSLSCVGCHERTSRSAGACAGCHVGIAGAPQERTCSICHQKKRDELDTKKDGLDKSKDELAPLPEHSDDYPARVTINTLVDEYGRSEMPHGAIVKRLDAAARQSELATTFHGDTDTLCSGCHHYSPVGERPPPCRACHSSEADPLEDQPGLKAAYHRQCMGCHEQMKLKVGCEDCHEEVSK